MTTNNANVDIRGAGVTLEPTSSISTSGTGVISVDAATGTLINAGAITNNASATDVTLIGDKMNLAGGTVNGGSGNVILRQSTNGTAIDLGSALDTGFALSNTELGTVTTTGALRIGNANSGQISATTAIDTTATAPTLHLTSGAGIDSNDATDTITATSLALQGGSLINVVTAADNLAATTSSGGITIANAAPGGTLTVTTVDGTSGLTSGGTAISLTEATGHVTLSQPVNAGASTVAITLDGNDKLLTNGTTLTGTGGVTLTADKMALGGSIVATGQTVTLKSKQTADAIRVGVAGDATADTLELSDAELDTIAAATVVVGAATQSGGIAVGGNFNTASAHLTLTTGGAITRSAGALGTGGTGNLTLNAVTGIGVIATAPVAIGTVGGSLSATNTTSGDLYLSTGAITVGAAGVTLLQQASFGHLRVDSTGQITIGGDLTSGVAGNGTISLNPTGALVRTNGTLTADAINLGTNNNATAIGATGAGAIRIAGGTTTPAVAASATTGGVFINQVLGDIHTSDYALDVAGAAQAIELATTDGQITIDHNYTTHWNANTQDDNVSLIARGTDKNIIGGSTLITSGNVTLDASGGIGVGTAVNTSTTGNLNLITGGAAAAGDITLVEANALNTSRVFLTTAGSAQSVSLTSTAGPITLGANIGNTTDDLTLIASAGDIIGGAGTATASNLTLTSSAGGIGVGTAVNTEAAVLRASATTSIDIFEATAVKLGDSVSGVASSGGNITIATTNGAITTGNSVKTTGGNGSISLISGGTGGIALGHDVSADGTGDVRLMTGGAVTQSAGAITANNLGVRANTGVSLTQGNDANTVAILNTTGNPVSYTDTDGFAIGTVGTLGAFSSVSGITNNGNNVTLSAGGAVTQTQAISAGALELLGAGPYTLTLGTNDVGTIAGNVTNAVQYTDANALTVGQVNATVGLTASDIVLATGGIGTDNLTLAQNVSAGAGDVRLVTAGALTQTGTATITADELGVRAQTGVTLANGNNASTIAIVNGTGNAVSYTDTDGFAIGTVGTLGAFTSVSGITNSGNNVTLTAGGAVTQTQAISAAGLELLGAGSYTLTDTGNNVVTLAGNVGGAVQYTDADALTVGQVNTTGLTAADIVIETRSALLADVLTLAQNVNAGNGDVRLVTGASVNQTGGAITADELGVRAQAGVSLTRPGNNANTLAIANITGNAVSYTDTDGFAIGTVGTLGAFSSTSGITNSGNNVTLSAGGAVTQTQAITAGALELLGAGPYTLTDAGNNVVTLAGNVGGAVQYTDADALTVDTVNLTSGLTATDIVIETRSVLLTDVLTLAQNVNAGSGDVRLVTGASVSQTGGATITADELGVRAQTGVSLANGNNANTVAIVNATGNAVSYTDTNGFAIGTVGTLGAFNTVSGITNNGNNVTLSAGGAVTQTQAISAGALELLGTGSYALTLATNDVNTIAASTGGTISFHDADDLAVGTVNTIGITTSSDNVTLQTGGTLAINQAVNLVGGNLTLNAGDATTQTAAITAAGLELLGTGPYMLTNPGNNVATIAGSTTGAINYVDANALAVGTVNATTGITTTANGAVTLNAGGALTLPVTLGNINADGAVSLTGTSISTAANITTSDDDITFVSPTILTGDVILSTGAGGAGNVLFSSTLTGTAAGADDLTITAGTGNVTFTGTVGATRLGAIQINSAADVTANAITALSLTQAAGTGTTALNAAVDVSATTTGVSVTTNAITIAATGDITSQGTVTLTGPAGISTAGDITTTGDSITFDAATTLTGDVALVSAGGGIAFNSSLTATNAGLDDLAITAGAGAVTVTGRLGATRLGGVTINSAGAAQFLDTTANQQAASLTVTSSTGTTFSGKLDLTGGTSLAAGAGNVSFLNGLNTGAASTFANTGTLQIGDNAADTSSIHTSLVHTAGTTALGGSDHHRTPTAARSSLARRRWPRTPR